MNAEVLNSAGKAIIPAVEEKVATEQEENLKPIWQKKLIVEKRFTAADLWNIRKNAKRFKAH